ncbi:hypothetical protein VSR01_09585 [Actinacidiphila sp. DG2A-62]|uniref:hypothetical protein n=1 Tax=Actinacidiphila sp. DG2A-62 TaxID=3108821 RepID=UPI002DBB85AA|nr:hypothetical protein [Actinacidiphila sp. DG2A-62]MEC3993777.1 hypothetical protein [Actinacidiphila sp. DG2A-62]
MHRWAALAAAPFRPPADLSADGAWRIPGLDFSTVRGLRYQNFTSAAMLLPNILELLAHVYEAPVGRDDVVTRGTGKGNLRAGDRTALVGMNIRRAEVIGPKDGAVFKARRYVQMDEETVDTVKNSGGFFYSLGPQAAGGEPGEEAFLAMLPAEVSFDDSTEYEGRRDGIEMDNRIETRRFRYYSFDLELQFRGPRGILRVQAPAGLYGMLPVQKEPDATGTYHLADGLEESLPDIFGDTAPDGAAVVRPADSGASAPAPQEQPAVPRSALSLSLSIQPRSTDTYTFDAPDGLPAEALEQVQGVLSSADPRLVAQGEEFAHRLGAEVAETIRSRWAAEGRNPANLRLELRMGSAHRMAAAVVLSRVVANELDHRVYVRVDRMSAIEICPAEATGA